MLPATSTGIPGGQQRLGKLSACRELPCQEVAHDLDPQVIPARPERHLPPEPLGVTRPGRQSDLLALEWVGGLGGSKGVLGGGVDGPPELRQPSSASRSCASPVTTSTATSNASWPRA